MIQDLTKSVFRFGWAMGMLGVDQAANLLDRDRGWRRSTDSLDAVSDKASGLLGETARRVYEAGDHLQSGLVDTALTLARGATESPTTAMRDARRDLEETWSTLKSDLSKSRHPASDDAASGEAEGEPPEAEEDAAEEAAAAT